MLNLNKVMHMIYIYIEDGAALQLIFATTHTYPRGRGRWSVFRTCSAGSRSCWSAAMPACSYSSSSSLFFSSVWMCTNKRSFYFYFLFFLFTRFVYQTLPYLSSFFFDFFSLTILNILCKPLLLPTEKTLKRCLIGLWHFCFDYLLQCVLVSLI